MSTQSVAAYPPVFAGKSVLLTGGTGSLGKMMIRTLLSGSWGLPRKIIVLSRDEAKQHFLRLEYQNLLATSSDRGEHALFNNFRRLLEFRIGDVRRFETLASAVREAQIILHAAALKQVPTCEYFPFEAVQTNVLGAEHLIRAVADFGHEVETVVAVSTDKACKPVNVMGMSKALQERIFIAANVVVPRVRFVCVRYGNVLASRGSVIPLFHAQIAAGRSVTVTTPEMTRFLMPLARAVETIGTAVHLAQPGETIVPIVPSARIVDVARALIGSRGLAIEFIGMRPGEKTHEVLISEEEAMRVRRLDSKYYAISPMLPELQSAAPEYTPLSSEYSSAQGLLSLEQVDQLLRAHRLHVGERPLQGGELLG
ncbi:MAG: polysaccharide biosynthesis protein [Casimicrobiaceae bacterium]|nr:polysaccharide biosynthesis protein [Casimicrobiaceae bacterium]